MSKQSLWHFALVVLLEAASAVVEYLRNKLMSHINADSNFAYSQFA